MIERLKPMTKCGRIGLYLLIIGAVLFVVIESVFTLLLNQFQVISLGFWLVGMIGGIIYIVDLIKYKGNHQD